VGLVDACLQKEPKKTQGKGIIAADTEVVAEFKKLKDVIQEARLNCHHLSTHIFIQNHW
jgi:hypothetical protein